MYVNKGQLERSLTDPHCAVHTLIIVPCELCHCVTPFFQLRFLSLVSFETQAFFFWVNMSPEHERSDLFINIHTNLDVGKGALKETSLLCSVCSNNMLVLKFLHHLHWCLCVAQGQSLLPLIWSWL